MCRVLTGECTAIDVEHLIEKLERTRAHAQRSTKVVSFPTDEQGPPPALAPATVPQSPEPIITDKRRSPSPSRSKVSWLRSPFSRHRRARSEEPKQEQRLPVDGSAQAPLHTADDSQEAPESTVPQSKARDRGNRTPAARVRSLSPFSGGAWLPHWRLPHLNKKGTKASEGETAGGSDSTAENDFSDELLQSLRQTATTSTPVQEQRVFAKVGQKWEKGVVVRVDAVGDQHRVQVQVNGSVQSLNREEVVVPVQTADCTAETTSVAPTVATANDWSISELVASLKEDDKSQPLVDGQQVFASLKGRWKSGVVVMSREVESTTCYTVMVGRDMYDLNREDLCAHVAPESDSGAVSDALPTDADTAVGDDLAQSLKLDKNPKPISENQPVFAKVDGDWQMGVVVSVRSDAQQQMVYSIHLRHGVHDVNRTEICPRVKAPKKRSSLPRWQQGILNKFQRPKSAKAGDAAGGEGPPDFPSAAEALQQAPRQESVPAAVAEGASLNFQNE